MNEQFSDFLKWMEGGNRAALALGVSEATISRWRNGQQIPVDKAKQMEAISRGNFRAAVLLGLEKPATEKAA